METSGKRKRNKRDVSNTQNLTQKQDIDAVENEKVEQERTRIKKDLFVVNFVASLGSVKASCAKTEISRETYYLWIKNDPDFSVRLKQAWKAKLEDVEQGLNELILKRDGPSIRYFLDRRHPLYKPRVKVEGPVQGELSADEETDQLLWDDDFVENDESNTTKTESIQQPDLHRGEVSDSK